MPKKSTKPATATKSKPAAKQPAAPVPAKREPIDRIGITIPGDWRPAFEAAALAEGKNVSQWLGDLGRAQLPADVAAKLSARGTVGRPKIYTGRPDATNQPTPKEKTK
jgi:hypothetical protein